MRIGILEDEARDRALMARFVIRWAETHGIPAREEAYPDAESFLAACARIPFDVALLDCYLDAGSLSSGQQGSGVDVARVLRSRGDHTAIVFTTSSRDFAVEGYEVQALGYLLKPVDFGKLSAVLDRAASSLGVAPAKTGPTLALKCSDGLVDLDPSAIVWCRSQGHYLEFHLLRGKTLRARMTFTELASKLADDERFFSGARGYLVNLDEVSGVEGVDFVLRGGGRVPISQASVPAARAAWAERVFARIRV